VYFYSFGPIFIHERFPGLSVNLVKFWTIISLTPCDVDSCPRIINRAKTKQTLEPINV
jgi:hypothetical protein